MFIVLYLPDIQYIFAYIEMLLDLVCFYSRKHLPSPFFPHDIFQVLYLYSGQWIFLPTVEISKSSTLHAKVK